MSYRFCLHKNGTVRYRFVPISGSLFRTAQFLDLFWNEPLDFFRIRVNATPLSTTFWNGPKWNGTISYSCEQGLMRHCQTRGSSNLFDTVSLYRIVSRARKYNLTVAYESVLILIILHHIVIVASTRESLRFVGL